MSIRLRAGFTLIEVLVVVAIIALLAAILLPSLMKAREQSTGAVCSTNMHQIMLGMHMYVAANKVLPGTGSVLGNSWSEAGRPGGGSFPSGAANWKPGDSWLGLPYVSSPYLPPGAPPPPWNISIPEQQAVWDFVAAYAPHKGSLYRYVRNEKAYLCPKDSKGNPDPEDPKGGGGNGRFSYTLLGTLGFRSPENCIRFKYAQDMTQATGAMNAGSTRLTIKAGTAVNWGMSKLFTLVEEHPWNNTNHGRPSDDWAFDSYLAFRHHTTLRGGKGMFAFLDGHVEAKQYDYFVLQPGSVPPTYNKFVGVDLFNQYKMPYPAWTDGGNNADAAGWIYHFAYPYK